MKAALISLGVILGAVAFFTLIFGLLILSDRTTERNREALADRINNACLVGYTVKDWASENRLVRVYCQKRIDEYTISTYSVAVRR